MIFYGQQSIVSPVVSSEKEHKNPYIVVLHLNICSLWGRGGDKIFGSSVVLRVKACRFSMPHRTLAEWSHTICLTEHWQSDHIQYASQNTGTVITCNMPHRTLAEWSHAICLTEHWQSDYMQHASQNTGRVITCNMPHRTLVEWSHAIRLTEHWQSDHMQYAPQNTGRVITNQIVLLLLILR